MTVHSATRFTRPIYAGNALLTLDVVDCETIVATVRTASFEAVAEGGSASIEPAPVTADLPGGTRFVELSGAKSDRPDLQTARRVVSRRPRTGQCGQLQDPLFAGG